jgi:uncharacterized membrane protein required for colicin V production
MTWPDYVVIGLCIVLGMVQSRRGFLPAVADLAGCVLIVQIAPLFYHRFASESLSYAGAYLITVISAVVVLAVLTSLLKRYTQYDIGSFDGPLAGVAGIITALVLSHAMYGAVILAYGMNSEIYQGSAFAGQIYELQGWRGFLGFMSKVGTTDIAQ